MIDFYRGGSSKVFLGGCWSGLPIKKIFQTVTPPSPRRQLFREKNTGLVLLNLPYQAYQILKIRTLEMPFPAIWALNYELQFDFKKGKTLEIMPYF
jgi:hypothetical protein